MPQLHGKRDLDIYSLGQYDVTRRFLPTFVTLIIRTNPSTARLAPSGLFDQIFGKGFKLRSVAIETTTDPTTEGIENKIPWIGNYDLETTFERQLRGTNAGSSSHQGAEFKKKRILSP